MRFIINSQGPSLDHKCMITRMGSSLILARWGSPTINTPNHPTNKAEHSDHHFHAHSVWTALKNGPQSARNRAQRDTKGGSSDAVLYAPQQQQQQQPIPYVRTFCWPQRRRRRRHTRFTPSSQHANNKSRSIVRIGGQQIGIYGGDRIRDLRANGHVLLV